MSKLFQSIVFIVICVQTFVFGEDPNANVAPFVVFTPPKTGTRLCGKTMSLITGKNPAYYTFGIGKTDVESALIVREETKNGRFVVSHQFTPGIFNLLIGLGYKVIFVVRDPRDHLISVLNWLHEGEWEYIPVNQIEDPVDQLTDLITGKIKRFPYVELGFLAYEWNIKDLPPQSLYVTHFEHLVGSKGNGSDEVQLQEVYNLANFIDKSLTDSEAKNIASNIFGGTTTFRKGLVGVWKTEFTLEQKRLFRDRYNDLLIRLNYEVDDSWCP